MKQSVFIYSLAPKLERINPSLAPFIGELHTDEVLDVLQEIKPNAVIFDFRQLSELLAIISKNDPIDNRFICVGDELGSEERLSLLDYNIEFIKYENFIELEPSFFEIQHKQLPYRVLVVDDDIDQVSITTAVLKNSDMTVQSTTKGEEVLDHLDSFDPDLLLVDLYLEGITGDKLVKAIRKNPKYQFLPIVFLTSDSSIESRMLVLNAGADDLLTKPINSDLLVSALKNRMDRNDLYHSGINSFQTETTAHLVEEHNNDILDKFLVENKQNESASIIWFKVVNKHILQKKLGFTGFIDLCKTVLDSLPIFGREFEIKSNIAEGVFVLASINLDQEQSKKWVEKLRNWFSENYFLIQKESYYVDVNAIILTNLPVKKSFDTLIQKAENILIDGASNQKEIALLEEGVEEERYFWIKSQLENAIKTRNFNWLYQTIFSTKNESEEIYELQLNILTDSDKELIGRDYVDVANKTGLIKILDRFTLEHAIRIIRSSEPKKIHAKTLLSQVLSDYTSKEVRAKQLQMIKNLKLPKDSMVFQIRLDDALEHMDILGEIGRELNQANINICLSKFDASDMAWNVARKLQANWIRLKSFTEGNLIFDPKNINEFSKVVKKAHVLGYKIIVAKVDSATMVADLFKLNIDYLQGDFIQGPSKNIL